MPQSGRQVDAATLKDDHFDSVQGISGLEVVRV
jgi:hypothetical protein